MRMTVDRSRCQGVGMCESVRPDVFEVDDDGELILHEDAVTGSGEDLVADLEQAVESCPTQALALQR